MLAVPLCEQEVTPLLNENLSLSAINGAATSVISGTKEAVEELASRLRAKGLACVEVQTSHAFHSHMMEPITSSFTELVKTVKLHPPEIPYISNVTGSWITAEQVTDPNYWAKHLCQPVRFTDGIDQLWQKYHPILLEVGAGQTLSSLALQSLESKGVADKLVLPSLRHSYERQSDVALLLRTLGQLWLSGIRVNWSGFYANERRHRLPLPTYPFDRQRYWIDLPKVQQAAPTKPVSSERKPDLADWFYIPVWKQSLPPIPREIPEREKLKSRWLVFVDECGVGSQIATRLQNEGHDVICVRGGEQFGRASDREYIINPRSKNDYYVLIGELLTRNQLPDTIIHLWSITLTPSPPHPLTPSSFEQIQHLGFYSLLFLTQALDKQLITEPLKIWVLSNGMHGVESADAFYPEKTTLLGLCKVIPQEYSNVTCQTIDFVHKGFGFPSEQNLLPSFEKVIDQLLAELTGLSPDLAIAYRGHQRWIQTFEPVRFDNRTERPKRLREGGVYLITGGLGKIGLILAQHLARTMQAKLVLIGRSGLPAKSEWEQWLATHDDRVSTRIRQVQELEELGAEVLVCSADVADEAQMRKAIAQAEERFGKIHGVIHAAATLGDKFHRTIQETGYSECDWQFQPKVYGLYTLEKVLQGKELDFCLLMSSIASVLGGVAVAAYSAANAFVDAFAHKQHQLNLSHWCSANWFHADKEQSAEDFQRETVEVFQRILSNPPVPQVTIWRSDLTAAIAKWIKRESWTREKDAQRIEPTSALYPSLNRRNPYVAPSNEIERKIASIYQHLLGIEQVGIHDNFFELGGNSLIGTQLISQLRKEFQVELSVRHIFERPTVAEQALVIQQSQGQAENKNINAIPRSDPGNAQEILANLDQLSDEEVNSLLSGILSE
jgi:acyl transferase domain-containing protein/acyl carrier protein